MKRCKLLLLLGIFLFFSVVYKVKPYYTPAIKLDGLNVIRHDDDTIRVAYIGDSWAEKHKHIKCEIDSLVYYSTGKHVVVKTAGESGLTSKNIYYSIFRNESMRSVIEWGPDFCFVVAGINDSDRKMGKHYYQQNMKLIIDFLLKNKIVPIILEIPSYDIRFSYQRRSRSIKMLYLVSMFLTFSKMDCIQDYREAYKEMIESQNWEDNVLDISIGDWNPDGYRDKRNLYDAGLMHLNTNGYKVLDSCISRKIIYCINAQSDSVSH